MPKRRTAAASLAAGMVLLLATVGCTAASTGLTAAPRLVAATMWGRVFWQALAAGAPSAAVAGGNLFVGVPATHTVEELTPNGSVAWQSTPYNLLQSLTAFDDGRYVAFLTRPVGEPQATPFGHRPPQLTLEIVDTATHAHTQVPLDNHLNATTVAAGRYVVVLEDYNNGFGGLLAVFGADGELASSLQAHAPMTGTTASDGAIVMAQGGIRTPVWRIDGSTGAIEPLGALPAAAQGARLIPFGTGGIAAENDVSVTVYKSAAGRFRALWTWPVSRAPPNSGATGLASPDGKVLAVPVGRAVWLVATASGRVLARLVAAHASLTPLAALPGGLLVRELAPYGPGDMPASQALATFSWRGRAASVSPIPTVAYPVYQVFHVVTATVGGVALAATSLGSEVLAVDTDVRGEALAALPPAFEAGPLVLGLGTVIQGGGVLESAPLAVRAGGPIVLLLNQQAVATPARGADVASMAPVTAATGQSGLFVARFTAGTKDGVARFTFTAAPGGARLAYSPFIMVAAIAAPTVTVSTGARGTTLTILPGKGGDVPVGFLVTPATGSPIVVPYLGAPATVTLPAGTGTVSVVALDGVGARSAPTIRTDR